jgi:uncharacterized protein (TIGR00369 family)
VSQFVPVGQSGTFLDHVGGLTWVQDDDGVRVRIVVEPHHTNPNGTVHGGVILTLLDFGLGVAAESALPTGADGHPITIQLSSSMIGAARLGDTLETRAHVSASTRTMSFADGEIVCNERVIATASAVFRNPRPATVRR